MGKTITEVSHPGTKGLHLPLKKACVDRQLHQPLAVWDPIPKERSIREKEGH